MKWKRIDILLVHVVTKMAVRKKARRNQDFPGSIPSVNYRSAYCSDKRLLPRMKEYMMQLDSSIDVDLDDMVSSLQATYPEYARKKKQAFRSLVGKLYQSFEHSDQDNEDWLERKEREHFEKRMKMEDEKGNVNEVEAEKVVFISSEEEEEAEAENESEISMDIHVDPEDLTLLEAPMPATVNSTVSDSSDSTSQKHSSSSSSPPRNGVVDSMRLNWQSLTSPRSTPPLTTDPSHNEATPMNPPATRNEATPTSLPSALKKVTFSTPEVTANHHFPVPDEAESERTPRIKIKKVKKRRRHHSEDQEEEEYTEGRGRERVGTKRRRIGEESERDSFPRQPRNTDFIVQTSSVRFSDIGGCDKTIKEISKLLLHLRHPEVFTWLGVTPPQGFLLHGPPGCGKTMMAHAVAGELRMPFIKLAATEVVSGVSGESESTIRDLFALAKSHAPCVLFIDDIDAICRKREGAQREMERRIVTQLLASLDDLNQSDSHSRVLVIGATSSPDSLDPGLRRAGRFDREIPLGIPDRSARESILKVLSRGLRLQPNLSFASIARDTPGFVGADLMALIREAALCAVSRVLSSESSGARKEAKDAARKGQESSECGTKASTSQQDPVPISGATGGSGSGPDGSDADARASGSGMQQPAAGAAEAESPEAESDASGLSEFYFPMSEQQLNDAFISELDFQEAITIVQPSAKREGFVVVPDIAWTDVGALEEVREELDMAILAPVRYPDKFSKLGIDSPSGVLLTGPPGCGKTLLAKAIANECGINFISVKGPELLNMYVGESERAVRQVFQRAKNSAPCVIFFDELDALCPKRSDMAESSAGARVVNQLLTEMDGIYSRKQVFIMGATNRPDIIDPAILRPGRMDKVLYVGLPSVEGREAILKTITRNGTRPELARCVDLALISTDPYTHRFSGADLSALVREAAISALRDFVRWQPFFGSKDSIGFQPDEDYLACETECIVRMKHFHDALRKVRPSVTEKDRVFYELMGRRLCMKKRKSEDESDEDQPESQPEGQPEASNN